ncbi:DNRLRE domain-containing protein, partial [candidate division KSB1 bacterium]
MNKDISIIRTGNYGKVIFKNGHNFYSDGKTISEEFTFRLSEASDGFDYESDCAVKIKIKDDLSRIRVNTEDNYVEYRPVNILDQKVMISNNRAAGSVWNNVEVELIAVENGVKENILLLNNEAQTTFEYVIETDLNFRISDRIIYFEDEFISEIKAFDANQNIVPVNIQSEGDLISIEVDTSGAVYPITVDPTIIWKHGTSFGKDTYLQQNNPGDNFGDIGSLYFRQNGGYTRRAVIQFDSIQYLPEHAIISDAKLILIKTNSDNGNNETSSVHRITQNWIETEASWDSASFGNAWSSPGGDYDSFKFDTQVIGSYNEGDSLIFDITDLVIGWHNSSWNNYGLLIKWDDETKTAVPFDFASSEYATSSYRPALVVEFTETTITYNISDSSSSTFSWSVDTSLAAGAASFDSLCIVSVPGSALLGSFTELSGVVTGLMPDSTYISRVMWYNADTLTVESNTDTVRTLADASIDNPVQTDTSYNFVVVSWDTLLNSFAPFDSFAVLNSSDSLRYSPYTIDTIITVYGLEQDSEYNFKIGGYNLDTLRSVSASFSAVTFVSPITPPLSFNFEALGLNTMTVSVVDTNGLLTNKAVFQESSGLAEPETVLTRSNDTTYTAVLDFLNNYDSLITSVNVLLIDTLNADTSANFSIQRYTAAQPPPAVTVTDTSETSYTIAFNPDLNPERVFYQLFDSAQALYISPQGDTSATDTSWYQKSLFDTLEVYTSPNVLHELYVNARNSDSLKTGYFYKDSVWSWAEVPDVLSAFAHSRDSVLIILDPKNNPDHTFFAVEDAVTGLFIDVDSHSLRSPDVSVDSTWAWGTFANWGNSEGYFILVEP